MRKLKKGETTEEWLKELTFGEKSSDRDFISTCSDI